jgi:GntR family transcriptional regulator, rspAB operon transcriptional repressor
VPTELKPLNTRPGSLTEMVLAAIRDAIVDKTLAPGQRVSEASLAAALHVSKTPVREALLRLSHIGLVEPVDRGMRVITPAVRKIRDAYELRAGVERTAAILAAGRAMPDDLAAIAEAADASLTSARAGDAEGFRRHDREFHEAVAAAARNESVRKAVDDLLVLTRALRDRDVPDAGDSLRCADEHVAIIGALRRGDADTAGRLMAEHVQHVMEMVLSSL